MTEPISLDVAGLTFTGRAVGPTDGPTVLLLHGFPQTSRSWSAVASRLAAAGLRCVAVDQRGYSPGARPGEVSDYALPLLIGDVIGLIAALGGPVHLVGHDWGAVVGWQVTARHPDLVRTWTAVSAPHQLALNEVLVDPEQRARFGYISRLRRPGSEAALLADDARALRELFGPALPADRLAEDVASLGTVEALRGPVNWYRAMAPSDSDGLGPVTVPTTYVWGRTDVAFSPEAAAACGSHVDADYRFVALDGVSHWVPDEAPGVLAEEILHRVG